MANNKWDEDRIEKILCEMPNIKDSRLKKDVLARLQQDERLQSSMNIKAYRKKTRKLVPIIVSVVALFVLILLLPSMLNGGNGEMDEASNTMSLASDEGPESAESGAKVFTDEDYAEDELEMDSSLSDVEGGIEHFAVYPHDVDNDTVFRLGLVGDTAGTSIPVTFIIPNSQIEEDFGEVQPTSFDLYEKYAARIDEEALGFYDYHPYEGKLTVVDDAVIQTLPKGHGYDRASATMEAHKGTLQDTFYGFSVIKFENEDGTAVEFDQVGEASTPMQLTSGKNHYNYYVTKQENGQEYLSSNFSKSYENLETALHEMKDKPNDIFSSVIPENINFEVIEGEDLTVVKFEEPLDLMSMDPIEAKQMIDGILLTAASFETQLQFENVIQSEWNGFNFNEPLPIPVGLNRLPFLLK